MSYYKHAQYAFSHKLKRALKRGHHSAYGRYKAELAYERQRRLARFKMPRKKLFLLMSNQNGGETV